MTVDSALRRVVVALDATTPLRESLHRAADLASCLHAELHILFVQDDDIRQLAELPFTVEICHYGGETRALTPVQVALEQRSRVRQARLAFERVLGERHIRGTFTSLAGCKISALMSQRRRGDIVWLTRRLRIRLPEVSATRLRDTLYAVYNDSDAGRHTLQLAAQMLRLGYRRTVVWVPRDTDAASLDELLPAAAERREFTGELPDLLSRTVNSARNALLIPDDLPLPAGWDELLNYLLVQRIQSLIVH